MAKSKKQPLRQWTAKEKSRMRESVERWKWLGPLLESMRHDELRAMSETDYFKAVERVWSVEVRRSPRRECGLVEFQKALRR